MDSLTQETRTVSSPPRKPYRRVIVFVDPDGHRVGGTRTGAFYPEGTFPTVHAALDHALSLPVDDPAQPISVMRTGVRG